MDFSRKRYRAVGAAPVGRGTAIESYIVAIPTARLEVKSSVTLSGAATRYFARRSASYSSNSAYLAAIATENTPPCSSAARSLHQSLSSGYRTPNVQAGVRREVRLIHNQYFKRLGGGESGNCPEHFHPNYDPTSQGVEGKRPRTKNWQPSKIIKYTPSY